MDGRIVDESYREPYDFTGKRVGIIGTGAGGIEVGTRGHGVMLGYFDDAAATKAAIDDAPGPLRQDPEFAPRDQYIDQYIDEPSAS